MVSTIYTLVMPTDTKIWETQVRKPKWVDQKPRGKAWKASLETLYIHYWKRPKVDGFTLEWTSFPHGHCVPTWLPSAMFSSLHAEAVHAVVETLERNDGQILLQFSQNWSPHCWREKTTVILDTHMLQQLQACVLQLIAMSTNAEWATCKVGVICSTDMRFKRDDTYKVHRQWLA